MFQISWRISLTELANQAAVDSKLLVCWQDCSSQDALYSGFRVPRTGVAMAETAMARKYPTVQAATAAMDTVAAILEDEARSAYNICDNQLYLELTKYIVDFKKMMNDLAYRLPGLITVDFSGGVHPLVAAYVIYNDAKRHRISDLAILLVRMDQLVPLDSGALLQYEPVVITVGSSETYRYGWGLVLW